MDKERAETMIKHMITKIGWNLLCAFLILTMLAACSRDKASTRSMAQHEAEARAYTVTGNPNQGASSLDERAANHTPIHQQGSSYVEISGGVSIDKNTVKVTGHSNLPAGARIKGNLAVKNSLLTGYTDETTIQKDGSFVLQVQRPGIQGSMDLTVLFRPMTKTMKYEICMVAVATNWKVLMYINTKKTNSFCMKFGLGLNLILNKNAIPL